MECMINVMALSGQTAISNNQSEYLVIPGRNCFITVTPCRDRSKKTTYIREKVYTLLKRVVLVVVQGTVYSIQ